MGRISRVRLLVFSVVTVYALSLDQLFAYTGYTHAEQQEKPSLTVIVHGTYWPALGLTNPLQLLTGAIAEDSKYARLLGAARDNKLMYEASFMLDLGYQEIPRSMFAKIDNHMLSLEERYHGAYFIAHAYDAVARAAGLNTTQEHYACFGWTGMLSHKARVIASEQLYKELRARMHLYKEIRVLGYSHGANVIGLLAEQELLHAAGLSEEELKSYKSLSIDKAIFWGCPIQTETADYLASPVFKSIISIFSRGDSIQTADVLTRAYESYPTMHELNDLQRLKRTFPNLHRCDVEILVNGLPHIDHFNMFTLDMKQVHPHFGMLPAVVLTPLIIKQAHSHYGYTALQMHIDCSKNSIKLTPYAPNIRGTNYFELEDTCPNIYKIIKYEQELVAHQWIARFKIAKNAAGQLFQSLKQIFTGV